jgi:hypothetical protein
MGQSGVSLSKTGVQSAEWVVYQKLECGAESLFPSWKTTDRGRQKETQQNGLGGASRKEVRRCEVGSRGV